MELADTEAGKNDESPVGAASASARTLGSVAAGIESDGTILHNTSRNVKRLAVIKF